MVAALLAALVSASSRGEREPVAGCEGLRFREAAAELGIRFVHDRGTTPERHLPETMGSGVVWLDYDGDGWLDLYAVQSGRFPPPDGEGAANRLFRNQGGASFADVTARSGAGDEGYGQGAVAADLDGDSLPELFVTNYGPSVLLRNRGDGTFAAARGGHGPQPNGWSSSAAFADADGDGDLDLYVTRYVEYDHHDPPFCGDPGRGERSYCDPSLFRGQQDRFFRNEGEGGLVDATEEAGLVPADGRGLGVVFTDLDGDGAPDLYVANDLTPNFLFRNRGDGTFEELSLLSGTAVNREGKAEAGMGIAVADVDADLDPDLAVTNFDVETNTLYVNQGGLLFDDLSAPSGFGPPSFNLLGFGIVGADLDRDGDVDYYVGNGHIYERPARSSTSYEQRGQVLLGDGEGRFTELRCPPLEERRMVARGVAAGDLDNDGDVDLAVQGSGQPLALLVNEIASGQWLGVRLVGSGPNSGAVGARLTLHAGASRVRWILAGDSYQSGSDPRALFGIPSEEGARSLEVRFPSGRRFRFLAPLLGRYVTVIEDASGW